MKRYLFLSLFTVAAVLFVWSFCFAFDVPEFDAVGCDSTNYFVDPVMREVISKNTDPYGHLINSYSSFPNETFSASTASSPAPSPLELSPDPCFTYNGDYDSALTKAGSAGQYVWDIVLQMQPDSDINLEIHACVLKHDYTDIWTSPWQTGRDRLVPTNQRVFVIPANPMVTVQAFPGPYASPGFSEPFYLMGRVSPSMDPVILYAVYYSSKSLWTETILIALPETGDSNTSEKPMHALKGGDIIRVRIDIPIDNTADVRYGQDSVILKYNGMVGTWYLGSDCAPHLGPMKFPPIKEKLIKKTKPLPIK